MPDLELSQIKNLFHQALALEEPERTEFLDQVCAGDALLRTELEAGAWNTRHNALHIAAKARMTRQPREKIY